MKIDIVKFIIDNFDDKELLYYIDRDLYFMGISQKFDPNWSGWDDILINIKKIRQTFAYVKDERLNYKELKNINKLIQPYIIDKVYQYYKDKFKNIEKIKYNDLKYNMCIASLMIDNIKSVYILQEILTDVGYSVEKDGELGNLTISAIREAEKFSISKKNIKRSGNVIIEMYKCKVQQEVKKKYGINGIVRYIKILGNLKDEFI